MFEYKVVFAPKEKRSFWRKDLSAKKLSRVFNDMAADDWEFQSSERGSANAQSLLIFRRRIPTLEELNEAANARVETAETFEKPIVPRRPRPQQMDFDAVPEFHARRAREGGAPVGALSVVMAAPK